MTSMTLDLVTRYGVGLQHLHTSYCFTFTPLAVARLFVYAQALSQLSLTFGEHHVIKNFIDVIREARALSAASPLHPRVTFGFRARLEGTNNGSIAVTRFKSGQR